MVLEGFTAAAVAVSRIGAVGKQDESGAAVEKSAGNNQGERAHMGTRVGRRFSEQTKDIYPAEVGAEKTARDVALTGQRCGESLPVVGQGGTPLAQRPPHFRLQAIDVDVELALRAAIDRVDGERKITTPKGPRRAGAHEAPGGPGILQVVGHAHRAQGRAFDPADPCCRQDEELRCAGAIFQNHVAAGDAGREIDERAGGRIRVRLLVGDALAVDDIPERVGIPRACCQGKREEEEAEKSQYNVSSAA